MSLASDTTALLATHKIGLTGDPKVRDEMRSLLELGQDVFSRTNFTPGHFTVSAFILAPDGDRLLLVEHPKLRRWVQPGGHFDPADRSPLAAALREIQEEVGRTDELEMMSRSLFDINIHDIEPRAGEPAHRHFDLSFSFRSRASKIASGAALHPMRWWSWPEIRRTLHDAAVLRGARKLLLGHDSLCDPG